MDDLAKAFDGAVVEAGGVRSEFKLVGHDAVVTHTQDVTAILDDAERQRNDATRLNLKPDFDNDGFVKLGSIPAVMFRELVASLPDDASSDEIHAEIMKRLSGDWSKLNTSKYRRLV
jgi:hypothetical protein